MTSVLSDEFNKRFFGLIIFNQHGRNNTFPKKGFSYAYFNHNGKFIQGKSYYSRLSSHQLTEEVFKVLPGCSSLRLYSSSARRAASSGLIGLPISSRGIMKPWNGHLKKIKIMLTKCSNILRLQHSCVHSYVSLCLTLTRSWRSHNEPLGIGALHLCSTGWKRPAKVMHLDFICADSSLFSTSSSTSLGTQNWCWEEYLGTRRNTRILLSHWVYQI